MPIVSYRLLEPPYPYHGGTVLRIEYTDHTGKNHRRRPVTEEDPETYMIASIPKVEKSLEMNELRSVAGRIEAGESPREVFDSRQHSNKSSMKNAILKAINDLEAINTKNQSSIDEKSAIEAVE